MQFVICHNLFIFAQKFKYKSMEELTFDSILSEDQIGNLFSGNNENNETPPEPNEDEKGNKEDKDKDDDKDITTTEADVNDLFGQPESVGSEETKEKKDTSEDKSPSSSNFYSSIAKALVEDGVLQDLDKEALDKIQSPEDFADAIQQHISNQLDERQKRIDEALSMGVEPSEIQKYENYIHTLESITEDSITSEDEQGENLRKNIIYQDCLNKGYSKERAMKIVEKSINAGTDIDDAKDALEDNKTFFKKQYQSVIDNAKKAEKERQKEMEKQAEKLKNSILNEEKAFGVSIDKTTRQKVYDSIAKPVYTDEEGNRLTAIQKYEKENRTDFLKSVGLLFVLTDGFKNIDKLVNDKVKKETRKSLRNLEQTLSSSGNGFKGGNMTYANNSGEADPESLFKGWRVKL